jgi:glycosyltransferase involved in cell wall biosynthesis
LEVIGDGEERERCIKEAIRLGISGSVAFRGALPLTQVYSCMGDADVFVQHNIITPQGQEEAIGGSLIEASLHALPVVSTLSGGISEAVVDGHTGVLVAPGDEVAMAEALFRLACSPQLRRDMGEAGRAYAQARFDISVRNQVLRDTFLETCGT